MFTGITRAGGTVNLTWTSLPGRTYDLQYGNSFDYWQHLATVNSAGATTSRITDNSADAAVRGFIAWPAAVNKGSLPIAGVRWMPHGCFAGRAIASLSIHALLAGSVGGMNGFAPNF